MEARFNIFPLGDSAATINLSEDINEEMNRKVVAIHLWLLEQSLEGVKDLIIGYSSLSVFYDPEVIRKTNPDAGTAYQHMKEKLEEAWQISSFDGEKEADLHRIPVCYDDKFGFDLDFVSRHIRLTKKEIIELHCSKIYRVYMIGFLPGFSYLGQLDEKLAVPRKSNPVAVHAGSVGIAGSQTGIYSLHCPGGWQIIGRTPLKLFDVLLDIPVKLKTGDHVEFYPINKEDFDQQ